MSKSIPSASLSVQAALCRSFSVDPEARARALNVAPNLETLIAHAKMKAGELELLLEEVAKFTEDDGCSR
jgi:hypothetical protein